MYSVEPKDLTVAQAHQYLLGGVSPRPIAFVSTISQDGINNLSPFSFFNAFGANPPVIAFSPAISGRTGKTKDTFENIKSSGECVVHAVTHSMIEQINLASCEYDSNIDEFVKAGFTTLDSHLVKPKRVKESPFQMECKLMQIVELGGKAGSGNLVICEVVKYHISEDILVDGKIDPNLLDLCARNGGEYYTRASGNAIFEIKKPGLIKGIGFDGLPLFIKESHILSANNLAQLALRDELPQLNNFENEIKNLTVIEANDYVFERFERANDYKSMLNCALNFKNQNNINSKYYFEKTAKIALNNNNSDFAWMCLLIINN
ncbi:MAG: flavin reductase family protein [Candidatus Kapabacteria bacterium]|nr:flavin reductase family protein [Candidatus Kapabacteria bacterium]